MKSPFSMRGMLAFLIVAATLAIFAFTDKLSFDQMLVVQAPVVALYFGQYIPAPKEHENG